MTTANIDAQGPGIADRSKLTPAHQRTQRRDPENDGVWWLRVAALPVGRGQKNAGGARVQPRRQT
jgi:hypothetical protein